MAMGTSACQLTSKSSDLFFVFLTTAKRVSRRLPAGKTSLSDTSFKSCVHVFNDFSITLFPRFGFGCVFRRAPVPWWWSIKSLNLQRNILQGSVFNVFRLPYVFNTRDYTQSVSGFLKLCTRTLLADS